jgi:hypothetical protein
MWHYELMLRRAMDKLCERCGDSGYYLGNGMITTSCDKCDGKEPEVKATPPIDKINRNSKSYQETIREIMSINPDISRKEAVKMFDEAYVKG